MLNLQLFLSIVAALGVISASLCAPALPYIADYFSADFSSIQFTISLFLVGNACGQFLSGPLSDQIGQRTVLLGGLFLYILSSCSCAIADQMGVLLAARFFQGMGSAVGPVLARAIAASYFPSHKSVQVQSYGAIGIGIASILAILTSGELTLVSWRSNFWLAACLGIILFLWAAMTLKKPSDPMAQSISFKKIFPQIKIVMRNPSFLGAAFCHSMTYGLMYGYIALFPFMLIEFFHEKNPIQVSIYSSYMIGVYMLGAFFASRLSLKWKPRQLIERAIVLQLIAGACLLFAPTASFFLAGLFLFNFSIGIILPLTIASALAPFVGQAVVGTASSSLGFLYRLIGSLLSTLICQFPLHEGKNLGLAMILLSAISLFAFKYSNEFSRTRELKAGNLEEIGS
jgi:DHA1 family bicyclomycin/chloramphenicol resistance-like MFS transporter